MLHGVFVSFAIELASFKSYTIEAGWLASYLACTIS